MTHMLQNNKLINLSENALRALAQNRITTILEFLHEDIIRLTGITKLSLAEVIDIRNNIFAKYSAPLKNGVTFLEESLSRQFKQCTGIDCIDSMLNGGIPTGGITEVCGLTDSGKTQLCFHLAIHCVWQTNNTVLYIDTKGDFSAVRIQKILEKKGLSHEEMASIMYKIKVIRVWTLREMVEFLQRLKIGSIVIERLALIIIDSLPCLTLQFLGDNSKIGLTLLNAFVNHCRYLSKGMNLAVVCVNIQTRWIDQDVVDLEEDEDQSCTISTKETYIEKRIRCLGKYWSHIPCLVLVLEKRQQKPFSEENSYILLTVLKASDPDICNRECSINYEFLGIK